MAILMVRMAKTITASGCIQAGDSRLLRLLIRYLVAATSTTHSLRHYKPIPVLYAFTSLLNSSYDMTGPARTGCQFAVDWPAL